MSSFFIFTVGRHSLLQLLCCLEEQHTGIIVIKRLNNVLQSVTIITIMM
jgi:hypothetical protein